MSIVCVNDIGSECVHVCAFVSVFLCVSVFVCHCQYGGGGGGDVYVCACMCALKNTLNRR